MCFACLGWKLTTFYRAVVPHIWTIIKHLESYFVIHVPTDSRTIKLCTALGVISTAVKKIVIVGIKVSSLV